MSGETDHLHLGLKNFHPFQLCVSGYSNSGKTTLISRLIQALKDEYRVGYAKHDAHRFEMDHQGKDTHKNYQSGAQTVYINDKTHFACYGKNPLIKADAFVHCDLVLVEGLKHDRSAKILILDEDDKALGELEKGEITDVVALVGQKDTQFKNLPFFHRDDIDGIGKFILKELSKRWSVPLYGLVLTGGRSSRMKKDKSRICYQGQPQSEIIFKMLEKKCEKVFMSCREDQEFPQPVIHDSFLNQGPMGGILSAQSSYPGVAFLVVACDLPLLDSSTIQKLIEQRQPRKIATTYLDPDSRLPEPLCSIYEPHSRYMLFKYLGLGIRCPRKMLLNGNVQTLELDNTQALVNCNTPEEYVIIKNQITGSL